jgi:hypothetical protein
MTPLGPKYSVSIGPRLDPYMGPMSVGAIFSNVSSTFVLASLQSLGWLNCS